MDGAAALDLRPGVGRDAPDRASVAPISGGLRFRPVSETIAGAAGAPAVEGVGLTPEREAELLAAWHGR